MIVIGDVHGCFDSLMALIAKFPKDQKIVFVGDLVDRGPKSKEVVDFVKDGGYDCVKGNHEEMFIAEAMNPKWADIWINNGGLEALSSYKVKVYLPENSGYFLPVFHRDEGKIQEHVDWMKKLPLYIEYPDVKNADGRYLVISHSLVGKIWKTRNQEQRNKKNFEEYILWGRNNFRDNPEIYNIVGHTPQEWAPTVKAFYANVDTGCCFKGLEGLGMLSAIQFPEMIIYTQENIDKARGHME